MPWKTLCLLAALLLPPSALADVPRATSPHLEDGTLQNVLYVRAGDSSGTAFLLRYRDVPYIVTARHVVEACIEDPTVPLEFVIGGKRGRPIRHVELLAESRRSDLAVYTYEEDPANAYFPAGAGLRPSEEIHLASQVFLVGYPASLRQTYGSTQLRVVGGWIAGIKKYVAGSTVEYVDIDMAGAEHGHSGGPILVLQDNVIAVAVQRRTGSVSETIGATYAVPIKYVTALIDGTPVQEDTAALNETLRGTTLVCGLALNGKSDYDVWSQRIYLETGERIWGELGVYVASSVAQESAFQTVPSDEGSTLVIHTAHYEDSGDVDLLVQKVSRFGELLLEDGIRSRGVATTSRPEESPVAVSDGLDGALLAYEIHLEGGDVDIRAQRLDPQGRCLWDSAGVALASAKLVESHPAIVQDTSGGAIVGMEIHRPDGNVDVAAQRIGPDGALAWLEGHQSVLVASSDASELHPQLVPDGEGGAIVFYRLVLPDGRQTLLAQRISHHGELLWNEGKGGVAVLDYPIDASPNSVSVLPDGLGGAFVAMATRASADAPNDLDVAVQRVAADGRLLWGTPVEGGVRRPVLAASSTYPERRPVLGSDGQGGVVVVFESGSAEGDSDVLAQRVDGDGNLRWNEGERSAPVAMTFLSEHTPEIAVRQADRVLVVFEVDKENGRSAVACQALSLLTGHALYAGGKSPVPVTDSGDLEIQHMLVARDESLR